MKSLKVVIAIAVVVEGIYVGYLALSTRHTSGLRYLSKEHSSVERNIDSNPSFAMLDDVRSEITPLLWNIPPAYVGGIKITTVIDKCFDLTSVEVAQKNGKFPAKVDVVVLSNLNIAPAIFKKSEINHTLKMFAFFMHPVDRSVYLFKHLQRATTDPHYDKRVANMDLIAYLNYLKLEPNKNHHHHYRLGNWVVRSLVKKNRLDPLTFEDVEIATHILRKKCLVGLFNEMEQSVHNVADYFGWELSEARKCLNEMERSNLRKDAVEIGSEAWRILSEMNQYDIALFENINMIFWEQKAGKPNEDWGQNGHRVQDLFPFLTDVREIFLDKPSKGFPTLFEAPPHSSIQNVGTILDVCFDKTRATITDNNGSHVLTFKSIQEQIKQIETGIFQENELENMIILSNLNSVPRFLEQRQLITHTPNQATAFTILQHPVTRAVHMFQYLKTAENDVYYDERVAGMDFYTYLEFLLMKGNENHFHWFRMSNWMTRSLTNSPRTKILDDEDVNIATKVLQEHFIIGFYDNMDESLQRLKKVFGWKLFDREECLKTSAELQKSVKDFGSFKGKKILEEMNQLDLKLFYRAKNIFVEQGKRLS